MEKDLLGLVLEKGQTEALLDEFFSVDQTQFFNIEQSIQNILFYKEFKFLVIKIFEQSYDSGDLRDLSLHFYINESNLY